MAYPTEEELLAAVDPPRWIDRHFLRQDPFAFSSSSLTFHDIACDLSESLGVERNGLFCIGSGAVGLSVNPGNVSDGRLKHYDNESDLDFAAISARHFEAAWRELLEATQPHLREVAPHIQEHLNWQRKRLFDGAIMANKILGSLSFGANWIGSIDRAAATIEQSFDRSTSLQVWIFRDYWSLRNYVARGIVACQDRINTEGVTDE